MSDGRIIFITGTSGAGKSTLKKMLADLASDNIRVHDFDEVGVPEGADQNWRIKTSKNWLNYAKNNRKQGIHTVIIGQTSPEEIATISESLDIANISYGFIEISEKIIRERLAERNWQPDLINANVGWAIALRNQLLNMDDYTIFNGNSGSEADLSSFFKAWIMKLIC